MTYLLDYPEVVAELLWEHVLLSGTALGIAVAIALPIGYAIHGRERLASLVMSVLGVLYSIPSLVLMILLLPVLGLSGKTVVTALVIYCQIILVRNVVAGLNSVDPAVLEAATGLGMTRLQRLMRVQLPLALPVVLAGIRIAAVVATSIATVGALFGSGGLGQLLFDGIRQGRTDKILAGGLTVALLAGTLNVTLIAVERRLDRARAGAAPAP
jgi:osmoprotectant transport system permease protein